MAELLPAEGVDAPVEVLDGSSLNLTVQLPFGGVMKTLDVRPPRILRAEPLNAQDVVGRLHVEGSGTSQVSALDVHGHAFRRTFVVRCLGRR